MRLFRPFRVPVGNWDWRFGARDSKYPGINISKQYARRQSFKFWNGSFHLISMKFGMWWWTCCNKIWVQSDFLDIVFFVSKLKNRPLKSWLLLEYWLVNWVAYMSWICRYVSTAPQRTFFSLGPHFSHEVLSKLAEAAVDSTYLRTIFNSDVTFCWTRSYAVGN